MINVTVRGGEVTAIGHAFYDEPGRDIVCAGVSAITQAVFNWCIQHAEDAEACRYNPEPGNFRLYFVPKKRKRREWEAVKETALYGYSAIAAEYPQHVSVD